MGAELLLDTGAFVALLDRSERHHAACVAAFERWSAPIVTTEAVLTKTLYLVGPQWNTQHACLEFFIRGAFLLVPSSASTLQRVSGLMKKYRDVPVDYADAPLVALGEDLETNKVFTLDRRSFAVYRLSGNKRIDIIP